MALAMHQDGMMLHNAA